MFDERDTELMRRLNHAVCGLPKKQREVFLAHSREGLSYGEIAARHGLKTGQVERLFARALCRLTKQMESRRRRWWERWF